MPHGMCYLWQPDILWTSVISDVLTGLAYFSITAAVIVFVKRRKDLPYPWFFLLAGSVIFLACGLSHIVSAIVIWEPIYGVSAIVKAITAFTSVLTGIIIWLVLPFFLGFPSPSMLEKKNVDLQDSLDKLNFAKESLVESEKMASLGGLVAGVAHEINTPLGIGITASSNLTEITNDLSKKFEMNRVTKSDFIHFINDSKDNTAIISANLNRAAELVSSFKLVAVDQSNSNLRFYNIEKYTEKVVNSLKPALRKVNGQLTVTCKEEINHWGDPSVLTQIITNLVMNSLLHGFENIRDGSIEINITACSQDIYFHYQDSGCGISLEHQEKLFEPFFTTKRGKGSSGLGMHIVFNLVTQSLKGVIKCISKEGGGAQFRLTFPLDIRAINAKEE